MPTELSTPPPNRPNSYQAENWSRPPAISRHFSCPPEQKRNSVLLRGRRAIIHAVRFSLPRCPLFSSRSPPLASPIELRRTTNSHRTLLKTVIVVHPEPAAILNTYFLPTVPADSPSPGA